MAGTGDVDPTSQPNAGSLPAGDAGNEPVENIRLTERTTPVVGPAPYDHKPYTTKLRGVLALCMTGILLATIIGDFVLAILHCRFHLTIEQVNGFAGPIISTEAALLGTALGFYFGDRST